MTGLRLIDATAVPAGAWRNGGGVTRELLRLPARGEDWRLRISLADVAADGPFSPFDGVERWFAVVSGAGVRLRWPRGDAPGLAMDAASPPLRFDGGDPPDCRLIDGPTRDLNVMARRDTAQALLAAAAPDTPWRWAGAGRGIFTRRPLTLHRDGHAPLALAAGVLAWSDDADDTPAWWLAPMRDAASALDETADPDASPPAYWIGCRAARDHPPRHP